MRVGVICVQGNDSRDTDGKYCLCRDYHEIRVYYVPLLAQDYLLPFAIPAVEQQHQNMDLRVKSD